MALPRSLAFLRQGTGPQVLEVYLDPICPYSAKITRSLAANVLPLLAKGGKYEGKLSVIPRIYPQPFHYCSVYHSEALIVFGQTWPDQFWAYLEAIFDTQTDFYSQKAASLTPNQVRDDLSKLAIKVLEQSGKLPGGPTSAVFGKFRQGLDVVASANGGNEGTAGMKHNIKIGRQNGIHVTPTVLFDGLKEDSVSSSWGKEEWDKFLDEKMSA